MPGVSTSVVLVPGAPALVPELSGAAAADCANQVSVALDMLGRAASGVRGAVVLGSDAAGRTLEDVRSSLTRWGAAVPVGRSTARQAAHDEVPDPALLGWWFLDRAGIDLPRSFEGITGDLTSPWTPEPDTLVVVVADGPASLTARAPIPEDARGVGLDSELADWLRRGGPLPDPGAAVSEAVGWWSRDAWRALGAMTGERAAREAVSWAPFGVGYHCARWDLPSSWESAAHGGAG